MSLKNCVKCIFSRLSLYNVADLIVYGSVFISGVHWLANALFEKR